ncbi:putative G-type lectin S-receptor-like serine/threonine-protein [Sesbania bispinosa]|nr:putative G-type lectin S-receptor-like serine/threonine-protein [Sesbania bispinosa]
MELVDVQHYANFGNTLNIRLADSDLDGKENITSSVTQILTKIYDGQVVITAYDFYVFKYRWWGEKDQNLDNIRCCGGADLPWSHCMAGMEVEEKAQR